ncbi:MAG: lamin tail domain-containing protein [Acidobacteria bacterium]|nr:lamin tail domain-containing protein [Acidobacteriota bacterium]
MSLAVGLLTAILFIISPLHARAQSDARPKVVISQIYSRGGEAGATYRNDYVELFNRGETAIDINQWALQFTSFNGSRSSSTMVSFISSRGILVEPGKFVLVQLAGGANGNLLPSPDFNVPLVNLGENGGQIALVRNNPPVPLGACPDMQNTDIIDYVGYGAAAQCWEGSGAAPAPTITIWAVRNGVGCTDTNNNAADFHAGISDPRNSNTNARVCAGASSTSSIQFSAPQFHNPESDYKASISVSRVGDLSGPASVQYFATDETANDRQDYTTAFGWLHFAAGEQTKTFDVLLTDDARAEDNETIHLTLATPTGGATLGTRSNALLFIHDNDLSGGTSNPADDAQFFVRQHYHDFLNREPDAAGLAFWTNGITSCGADAACVARKRVDTSAAFFLSVEFQRTGFLVYRLYEAAMSHRSSDPVIVGYREFLHDTQEIGSGVIVGAQGWERKLDENTDAFVKGFVARLESELFYPAGMTPAEFVDTLNANAGGVLSKGERDALVAGISEGTETRATVLRRVAENEDFSRAQTNRAFVLMQYFGYLRRNVNDAPDTNYGGYDFWLGKLEHFGGDWRQAQMVFAFIDSIEYRQRFAP